MLLPALSLMASLALFSAVPGPETVALSDAPLMVPPTAPYGLLEVLSGHVTVATPAGLETLFGAGKQRLLPERGHLRFGAMSEAELGWMGKGSLRVQGPAAVEWTGAPFGGETLGLLEFARVQLEVRVGKLGIRLPGEVLLVAEHGAFELLSRSTGAYGVHNLGGNKASLFVPAVGGPERRQLAAGSWIWIDPADYLGSAGFESLFSPKVEEPVELEEAPPEEEPLEQEPPVDEIPQTEEPPAAEPAPGGFVLMGAPAFAPWEEPLPQPVKMVPDEPIAAEAVALEPALADLVFGEFSGPRGLIAPVGALTSELGIAGGALESQPRVAPLLELSGLVPTPELEAAPEPEYVSVPFGRSPGLRLRLPAPQPAASLRAAPTVRLAPPTSGGLSDLLNGGIDFD